MSLPSGYTARAATTRDAAAVAGLVNAFEGIYVEEPEVISARDVAGWWVRFDLPRDSLAVFGPDDRLAAFADIHERSPGSLDLDGYVHPDRARRGLGSALLDWGEREARDRGVPALRCAVLASDAAAACLLRARGFEPVRHFYRMLADLDGPPPEPAWPEGFAVSRFRPGDEAELHESIEDAFAEHWGHRYRDLDHYRRTEFEQPWWDPSLVYLVRAEDEVVAASINAQRFGMGFVSMIGTRKPWRGRGLGRALLLEAFGDLYRRGEQRVGLGVDAGNETGATRLYESVGMRVAVQSDVYEKRV